MLLLCIGYSELAVAEKNETRTEAINDAKKQRAQAQESVNLLAQKLTDIKKINLFNPLF